LNSFQEADYEFDVIQLACLQKSVSREIIGTREVGLREKNHACLLKLYR